MNTLVLVELLLHRVSFSFEFPTDFAVNNKKENTFALSLIQTAVVYHSKCCKKKKKILPLWFYLFICMLFFLLLFLSLFDTIKKYIFYSLLLYILLLRDCA